MSDTSCGVVGVGVRCDGFGGLGGSVGRVRSTPDNRSVGHQTDGENKHPPHPQTQTPHHQSVSRSPDGTTQNKNKTPAHPDDVRRGRGGDEEHGHLGEELAEEAELAVVHPVLFFRQVRFIVLLFYCCIVLLFYCWGRSVGKMVGCRGRESGSGSDRPPNPLVHGPRIHTLDPTIKRFYPHVTNTLPTHRGPTRSSSAPRPPRSARG